MIYTLHIFNSDTKFGEEFFVEIEIKYKSYYILQTMWQPKLNYWTWIDYPIINNKIDWSVHPCPIEFINQANDYVEKFFRLKAFL